MINRTQIWAALDAIEANPDAQPLLFLIPISLEAVSKCAFTAEEIEERVQASIEKTLKACLTQPDMSPPV